MESYYYAIKNLLNYIKSESDNAFRKRFRILFIGMIFGGFIDLLGFSVILPFFRTIKDDQYIQSNDIARYIVEKYQIDYSHFFITLIFLGLIAIVATQYYKYIISKLQFSFALDFEAKVSIHRLYLLLSQKLDWFNTKKSSDFTRMVLSDVKQSIYQGIIPLVMLISNLAIVVFITGLLFYIDFKATIIILLVFVIYFWSFSKIFRAKTQALGLINLNANGSKFFIVSESFAGIREIKIYGLIELFIDKFIIYCKQFSKSTIKISLYTYAPRYFLEALILCAIVLLSFLINFGYVFRGNLFNLTIIIIAILKMLPSIQVINQSLTQIASSRDLIESLINSRVECLAKSENFRETNTVNFKSIVIKSLSYSYPESIKVALNIDSFVICKNDRIGVFGPSGGGKSTFIDIISGLSTPQFGKITIETESGHKLPINELGVNYLAQSFFILNDTVLNNIILGDKLDMAKVTRVCELLELATLIESLKDGFNTELGDRGVTLSGGERQRLGLARVLYREAELLILDEPTSALNPSMEERILNKVFDYFSGTIIMTTHNLENLKFCNRLIKVENGIVSEVAK